MTADHTPERLSAEDTDALVEAARDVPILVGWKRWYREALIFGLTPEFNRILAAHLADYKARLAAVEALADEWERRARIRNDHLTPVYDDNARAIHAALRGGAE